MCRESREVMMTMLIMLEEKGVFEEKNLPNFYRSIDHS